MFRCGPNHSVEQTRITTISDESRIIAIVAGTPIRQRDLWDSLVQIGGQRALEDAVLDIGVSKKLDGMGLTVTELDLENERILLVETLRVERFEEALELLWSSQSLHESQVNKLIERNAGLRKLVSEAISLNDESIERMYQILYGPSAEANIIVCDTRKEVHQAHEALQSGLVFTEVAKQFSTDNSSSTGGFIGEVIYADPQWPASLREQLKPLSIESHSKPFLMDTRWVIIKKLNEDDAYKVEFEHVRTEVVEVTKRAQERLRMDQLSQQILQTYQPTIFDESIQQHLSPNRH